MRLPLGMAKPSEIAMEDGQTGIAQRLYAGWRVPGVCEARANACQARATSDQGGEQANGQLIRHARPA